MLPICSEPEYLDSCWVPGDGKGCGGTWSHAAGKMTQTYLVLMINAAIYLVVVLGRLSTSQLCGAILSSFDTDVRKCLVMKIQVLRACEQLSCCWGSGAVALLRSQNNGVKKPLSFSVVLLRATGLF